MSVFGKSLKQHFSAQKAARKSIKELRRHLDTMPVGYPRSFTGVEKRILKALFSPEQARAALCLGAAPETAEVLCARAAKRGIEPGDFKRLLCEMEKQGTVFVRKKDGEWVYSLMPFVVGFFETQGASMGPGLYLDTRQYMAEGMALEYLTTDPLQLRVVPVEKSLTPGHAISTYDEIRHVIKDAGERVGVARCICRKGHDFLGDPCKKTERRETCLALNDFGEMFIRNGWARRISTDEALEIVALSEKDGLVIELSNEKRPSFACMCCSCCCGIFEMLSAVPRPGDFVISNFHAALDKELCTGCGKCLKRCPTGAFSLEGGGGKKKKQAKLDLGKCIGCGLCVSSCKPGALSLARKPSQAVPPDHLDDLMREIGKNKKSLLKKISIAARAAAGRPTGGGR